MHLRRPRLSLLRIPLCGFRIRFGFGLGFCRGAASSFLAFRFFLAQGQHTRVFRHLCRATCRGTDGRPPLLALVIVLGALQHVFGFLDAVSGILLGTCGFGNRNGIPCLEQIQRDVRLCLRRRELFGRHID